MIPRTLFPYLRRPAPPPDLVPVVSVAISPLSATTPDGSTAQYNATAKDASGNVLDLTGRTVVWSSSDPAIAQIVSTGIDEPSGAATAQATAQAPGSTTITCTIDGVPSEGSVLTVTSIVASVEVSPPTASLTAGETVQLTAVVKDAGGNVLSGHTVAWFSSDESLATVDSTGLVTSKAVGSVTILAVCEEKEDSAEITISATSPATLGAPNYLLLAANSTTEVQLAWLPSQRHLRGDGWAAERSVDGGTTWDSVALEGIVSADLVNKNTHPAWRVGYDRTLPAPGASPLRLLYRLYETSGGTRSSGSEAAEVYLPVDDYTGVLPQATVDTTMPDLTGATILTVAPGGELMADGSAPDYNALQDAIDAAAAATATGPVLVLLKNGAKWGGRNLIQLPKSAGDQWVVVRLEDDTVLPAEGAMFRPSVHDPAATADTGNLPILELDADPSSSVLSLQAHQGAPARKWRFVGLRFRVAAMGTSGPTSLIDLAPAKAFSRNLIYSIDRATQTITVPAGGLLASNLAAGQVLTINNQGNGGGVPQSQNQPWRVVSVADDAIVVDGNLPDVALRSTSVLVSTIDPLELPEFILFDRCWIEGAEVDVCVIVHGISMHGRSIGVVGCYIHDIQHYGSDTQTINILTGPGPFLCRESYLHATGENFMLGGDHLLVLGCLPRDITFERIHLPKTFGWDFTDPARWDGKRVTVKGGTSDRAVKNNWEIKHGGRFVLRDAVLDLQINGTGSQPDSSPVKEGQANSRIDIDTHDITFEWAWARNIYGAFVATGMYYPGNGNMSVTDTRRVSVRNVLYEQEKGGWHYYSQPVNASGTQIVADGVATSFSGTSSRRPITAHPGSVRVFFNASFSLTDDGAGGLSGANGTGTIDYATGAITVTFDTPPPAGVKLKIDLYQAHQRASRGVQLGVTMREVVVDHCTLVCPSGAYAYQLMPQGRGVKLLRVQFTNNVLDPGSPNSIRKDPLSVGGGEADLTEGTLEHTTGGNLWIGQVTGDYPANDACPVDAAAAGMTNYGTGDYRIAAGSTYATFATDGGAPGCDIDTLMTRIAGLV